MSQLQAQQSCTPTMKSAVVLTSIAPPNNVMRSIAADCKAAGVDFWVIGDTKSPPGFSLDGCEFLGIEAQLALPFEYAKICPTRHYARKNIGYLLAIRSGVDFIVETDDDNMPGPEFYRPLPLELAVPVIEDGGWVNVYRYFTDRLIWPRGLPLNYVNTDIPSLGTPRLVRAPIQQGLANENPDVDAIYRLLLPLPFNFDNSLELALGRNTWCPYNSQNTVHYREAFPLLYLPACCSFRMTDIWRSFVAQRIAWANGWTILFRESTVTQERNDHNLMKDFEDEISGYVGNSRLVSILGGLKIEPGLENIPDAMRYCYQTLADNSFVGEEEVSLLDAWLRDLKSCTQQ